MIINKAEKHFFFFWTPGVYERTYSTDQRPGPFFWTNELWARIWAFYRRRPPKPPRNPPRPAWSSRFCQKCHLSLNVKMLTGQTSLTRCRKRHLVSFCSPFSSAYRWGNFCSFECASFCRQWTPPKLWPLFRRRIGPSPPLPPPPLISFWSRFPPLNLQKSLNFFWGSILRF